MSDNVVKYVQGQYSLVSWVFKRLKQEKNVLGLCFGQTGSGKTRAEMRLACDIDPTFEIRQIVFSFREFMEVLNSDWFKSKPIKQVIFEEAQTSMNSRNWQHIVNKLINHLLSTFRAEQIIVWFNCPYADFLDSQSMKLIHITLETRGINFKTNKCRLRLNLLEYNSSMQKYYNHSLFVIRNGQYNKLREFSVRLPPKELDKLYEQKKKEFNIKTNNEILAKIRKLESDEDESKQPEQKELTVQQEKALNLYRQYGTVTRTAKEMGIAIKTASLMLKAVQKKGYSLEKPINGKILPSLPTEPNEKIL